MELKFMTKRNANGNRLYLMIDTTIKIYSLESNEWFFAEDAIEIKSRDRKKLIETVKELGFERVDNSYYERLERLENFLNN